MAMKLGKKAATLLATAVLATTSLAGPASAQWGPGYNVGCVLYFRNWCANNWQAGGFASFSECWTHYSDLHCRNDW